MSHAQGKLGHRRSSSTTVTHRSRSNAIGNHPQEAAWTASVCPSTAPSSPTPPPQTSPWSASATARASSAAPKRQNAPAICPVATGARSALKTASIRLPQKTATARVVDLSMPMGLLWRRRLLRFLPLYLRIMFRPR